MTWYTNNTTFDSILAIGFIFALFIFIGSQFGTARYGGRFGSHGSGIRLGSKAGWILMEIPTLILFPLFFFMGSNWNQIFPLFFLVIWMFHYANRALLTPMLMRVSPNSGNTFSLNVIVLGWVTLFMHSYLNAWYVAELGTHYQTSWFQDPRFIIGLLIYSSGFSLNIHSDSIVRKLRSKHPSADEPRYKIPYGGAFKWVTCPQYLGEITSFIGLAVMTWNLGAVFVLAITIANLVPRARITHRWFQRQFDNYPIERKAIIPLVW